MRFNASHAARCVACHGVRSHPVPVALVGECSIPVARNRTRCAVSPSRRMNSALIGRLAAIRSYIAAKIVRLGYGALG